MFGLFGGLSLLTRLGVVAGIAAAIVGSILYYGHTRYQAGHSAAIEEIREEARERTNDATRAVERYRKCVDSGGVWDQASGQCGRGL